MSLYLALIMVSVSLMITPIVSAKPCVPREFPASLGGVAPAIVTVEEAERWTNYKRARTQEALLEARYPTAVYTRYRIEMEEIERECVSLSQLIDIGRGLFLRRFTRSEGYGHGLPHLPPKSRLQRGHFGGPDASACVDCHWKGGFAGGGDRVDNTYAFGDGEHLSTAEPRNPPPLWGVGWVQVLAEEMSAELQSLRKKGLRRALRKVQNQEVKLITKGIDFGFLLISSTGEVDSSSIEGIDTDLVIKPFGWRGVFSTLREFVEVSAHKHLGMQSEHLVTAAYRDVELGLSRDYDPDADGIQRELTEAQITALVSFLATLDTPQIELPTHGIYQRPSLIGDPLLVDTPAFLDRWQRGSLLFEEVGCSECHRPLMKISHPVFTMKLMTPSGQKTQSTVGEEKMFEIDLRTEAAQPHPENKGAEWLLPVFSDFKRHRMGEHLRERYEERGVPPDTYLTRRLWGLRKTSPYLHHGGAMTFEEAISAHGGEGSEAQEASQRYESLNHDEKSSLRLFLMSLSRGPAIRIR